ncbi:MAG TPA: crosslink repair DNA glycosylase YcaQ family protein, partial [Vicinamibacteria bacterium]|nr:crosslink repair DNA glycosylase YcaQ family protein [Vicinamibacteria bacterium]
LTKRLLHALWSSGDLAIRARPNFHRLYDLTERVIPDAIRREAPSRLVSISTLLSRALAMHGWAETRTLAHTWRLPRKDVTNCLHELRSRGELSECALVTEGGRRRTGWIRPRDLALAARLGEARNPVDHGVLLSPFDGLLWDRERVQLLFGFDQVLEVYKPAAKRRYGYYCMPVLAGDRLVSRCDLKADRDTGTLRVLSLLEEPGCTGEMREATRTAIARLASALGRRPTGLPSPRKAK